MIGFRARLSEPLDIAALAMFRILFGVLALLSTVRFVALGWVDDFYVKPSFFFKFWGFEWVTVPPSWALYAITAALGVLSLLIALGLFYRAAIVVFFLLFTYVELMDVTNYLNHYYLVSVLSFLMCFMPLNSAWSLDAQWWPSVRRDSLPAWMTGLLRFQVGLVYVFAALAKFQSDWLLHAQPLNIWLSARTETPMIGPWLDEFGVALAFSWLGFLHDLLIVPFLLYRPTRKWAYCVLVIFHLVTGQLLNIGMFPFIMIVGATVFFSPEWPRRWFGNHGVKSGAIPHRLGALGAFALVLWCVFQLAVPLRFLAYTGPVIWHEQGMRFAWKVVVREKNGSVTYRVKVDSKEREIWVPARRYLTSYQEREMSGQPDLILQLAHHIAADFQQQGYSGVQVRADALASLNGRKPRRLIDASVDLSKIRDGLGGADWILPAPGSAPIRLRPISRR